MTQKQIALVKSTWSTVAAMDPVTVGELFYSRLFDIAPQLRPMFHSPRPEQSKKLMAMINYVISKLDKLEDILHEVAKLAQRHVNYGVEPGHYILVGGALLWTLEKGLAENWNEEIKEAWTDCYGVLSSAMINASELKEQNAA
ncbi:MAG TPA: globin domain-containing protein [Chitinophagaceae bacterium]|nr:globin domain-containing protein [Chitinophagaceae bacterium]